MLAPTTKVLTAAEILKAKGLVEDRGLVAKLVAIAWVSLYNPKAKVPAIKAPVRDLKGLGNISFGPGLGSGTDSGLDSKMGSELVSGVGSSINFRYKIRIF